MTSLKIALLPWAALLGLLVACADDAGTPCRADHHCYSNSCTGGTCDSPLGRALADAIFEDDDASEKEPAEPTPRCESLDAASCTVPHCRVKSFCGTEQDCSERLASGLNCPFCKPYDCQAPCMQISTCTPR